MESRKRPHSEDAEESIPKKRAVSDDNLSPRHLNGDTAVPDELKESDYIEAFRKDAIFRRMKYYSREHERSQARVAELERRKHTCEAGLAALEACWTQIIDTIRLIVQPEDLPPDAIHTEDIFDLTAHVCDESDPEYLDTLRDKMHATSELVTALVRMTGQARPAPPKDDVYSKCQRAQAECSALRSELSLIRKRLHDVESEKEQCREQLVAAEKRVDRLQSKTVAVVEGRAVQAEVKDEPPPQENESPASPAPLETTTNGIHLMASDVEKLDELRAAELEECRERLRQSSAEVLALQLQTKVPSEDMVIASPYYQIVLERASFLEHCLEESKVNSQRLTLEIEGLQATRHEFEYNISTASSPELQELKAAIAKRDTDILRLREQRDQLQSELHERKSKDSVKLLSLNEYKTQSESRALRLDALQSEVLRLRSRLAATIGDEDLMTFLSGNSSEDVSYVSDIKNQLVAANAKVTALETTLASYQNDNSDMAQHMREESEVRERLAVVEKRLEQCRSILGDASSTFPPDIQVLSEQLQKKEQECQTLRLQVKQLEQVEPALYTELEKLSAAWEALDRQVKSKVFDLSAMEDRVTKAGLERAKSDNKFYSAMRDKEAVETERKNLARNLEKQAKVIETLSEAEKNLSLRVSELEKELSTVRKLLELQRQAAVNATTNLNNCKHRMEGVYQLHRQTLGVFQDKEKKLDQIRVDLLHIKEGLVLKQQEADRHSAKMKATAHNQSATPGSREALLQVELDKCMSLLKCSTCHMNMRNTVITKCMHSFCKSCVESRISTRQRKCPACNLPFSQGEVQTLFLQ